VKDFLYICTVHIEELLYRITLFFSCIKDRCTVYRNFCTGEVPYTKGSFYAEELFHGESPVWKKFCKEEFLITGLLFRTSEQVVHFLNVGVSASV
jgi:hypothetical protein